MVRKPLKYHVFAPPAYLARHSTPSAMALILLKSIIILSPNHASILKPSLLRVVFRCSLSQQSSMFSTKKQIEFDPKLAESHSQLLLVIL
jgi:hypothetical protein